MSVRVMENSDVNVPPVELPEMAAPLRKTPWFGPPPSWLSTAYRRSSVAAVNGVAMTKSMAYRAVSPEPAALGLVPIQRASGSLGKDGIQAGFRLTMKASAPVRAAAKSAAVNADGKGLS